MGKIDWNEAPEGYDFHFTWPDGKGYFYREMPDRFQRKGGAYFLKVDQDAAGGVMSCRPWDGSGFPQANSMVEIRSISAQTEWGKARVVFASRNVIVWDWAGEPAVNGLCTAYTHTVEVRPIRTPEQIEKEERESAIIDLMQTTCIRLGEAQRIYDAGYRKQKD